MSTGTCSNSWASGMRGFIAKNTSKAGALCGMADRTHPPHPGGSQPPADRSERSVQPSVDCRGQTLSVVEPVAQFIAVCSSSILAETLGYAVSFFEPTACKTARFQVAQTGPYGSTVTIYKC